MTWFLYLTICIGSSCTSKMHEMPDRDSCFYALSKIRVDNENNPNNIDKQHAVTAYCAPKRK